MLRKTITTLIVLQTFACYFCFAALSVETSSKPVGLIDSRDIGDAVLEHFVRLSNEAEAPVTNTKNSLQIHNIDPFDDDGRSSSAFTSGMPESISTGSIGPAGQDTIIITAPKKDEILTNLIFKRMRPSAQKIKHVLKMIRAPRGLTMVLSEDADSKFDSSDLGRRAFHTDPNAIEPVRLPLFDLFEKTTSQRKQNKFWGSIYYCQTQKGARERLFAYAARAAVTPAIKHYYLGCEKLCQQQWESAWKEFNLVRGLELDNFEMATRVADAYRQLTTRDAELCVWLDRSLELAPTWSTFKPLYGERSRISYKYALEAVKKERLRDTHWASFSMPLTIYFRNENDFSFDQRLISTCLDAFDEWRKASGYKVSIKRVHNPEHATIICGWGTHVKVRTVSLKAAMKALLASEHGKAGVTNNISKGDRLVASTVTIYSAGSGPNRLINDEQLYAVCLHESGHALGLQKHEMNQIDVMSWTYNPDEPRCTLATGDKFRISELYTDSPPIDAPAKILTPEPLSSSPQIRSIQTRSFDIFVSELF